MDLTTEDTRPGVAETERTGAIVTLRNRGATTVDAAALAAALAEETTADVRFDAGHRAIYAHDGSNYRQVPIGVVIPKSADDLARVLGVCRRFGAPFLSRGGGTSLAGQCCNVAVVADYTKHVNRILELDVARRRARVQPGLVLDRLNGAALRHGLRFGPDPSTHNHCTLGGMIGNNSCGVHSVMTGRTSESVDELEILTWGGVRMRVGATPPEELARILAAGGPQAEIYRKLVALRDRYEPLIRTRYPKLIRRVSGFGLDQLLPENGFHVARALCGTEGTCVAILEATVRLIEWPKQRSLLVLGYPSIEEGCDHVPEIMKFSPMGLEGMDDVLVEDMKKKNIHPHEVGLLPEGKGWLLVEFGGATKEEADEKARALMSAFRVAGGRPAMKLFDDEKEEEQVWKTRESGLGATARVPGEHDTWEGWEDSAVPPERVGDYLRELKKLFAEFGYRGSLYGHLGQGCVHTRIDFELRTAEGIAKMRRFVDRAADLVVGMDGSFSGEHGDGQSRAELLPKMYGDELVRAFGEFKAIWDPEGKMNPHKVVDPFPIVSNLRLGADFRPAQPATHFQYPDDDGSLSRATLRCVGIGECRREEGGTMCPSFRATHEEMHSTRGRAHLLEEMLTGDVIEKGWKDENVHEALSLCLACKGCKSDCPMNVDMATYKAEFLAHYYAGRLRPRAAYSMGLIFRWARLASLAPRVANFLGQTWPFSSLAKVIAGVAPRRTLPAFATESFKSWFRRQPHPNAGGAPVILWADTFNNYLQTDAAKAAKKVLEAAGFFVQVPGAPLCCGRPLYDFGMLDLAKEKLRDTLEYLGPWIDRGVPVVGLEPSCVAVFRDEMLGLFPHDDRARRLASQMHTLGEFLEKKAPDFPWPRLDGTVVVHGHCHEKAVLDHGAELDALKKCGFRVEAPDTGCCGMAGSFGFEADKYDVSMTIAEKEIFPLARSTPRDTLFVADGFSCREQVKQGTGRMPKHLAEVLADGLAPS